MKGEREEEREREGKKVEVLKEDKLGWRDEVSVDRRKEGKK